jgi:hypothetical protein
MFIFSEFKRAASSIIFFLLSNTMKKYSLFVFLFVLSLLMIACSGTAGSSGDQATMEQKDSSSPAVSSNDAYPAPEGEQSNPNLNNPFGSISFKLNPISEGDTILTGEGPAGIFLEAFDVTFNHSIGSGVIQDNNKFEIQLAEPIVAGRLIGIMYGAERDPETWMDLWALRGTGARSVPNIGYFFDSQISQPKQ